MKFNSIVVKNFRAIKEIRIEDIENTLILVGKNNSGKSMIIEALCILTGDYVPSEYDFVSMGRNIHVQASLKLFEEELYYLFKQGKVSQNKNYEKWFEEVRRKIPMSPDGIFSVACTVGHDGIIRFQDETGKNNPLLKQLLPKIYKIDHRRNLNEIHKDIFQFQGNDEMIALREKRCIFDDARECNKCFNCIDMIERKESGLLNLVETARLMEYKMYCMNLGNFTAKINELMAKNGAQRYEVDYKIDFNIDELLKMDISILNQDSKQKRPIDMWSEGIKTVYLLSLFEAYSDESSKVPCIITLEEPETYLHPQMQKVASEILYRLSKKNQVIFSTHSPTMVFNFSTKQIRQVAVGKTHHTDVKKVTDIDEILNDLGYAANDLMNVSFVFIVEGKQDRTRLPLLLKKYYSEVYDETGGLKRIAIIETNSCTNIKTYANLKYMNKAYLKDQFLMIRDSDGKDREYLQNQLCDYYFDRSKQDVGNLPRITPKNVLVLKYYSFENYFLNPSVMKQIGIVKSVESFYNILWNKWNSYLRKLSSAKNMQAMTGVKIRSKQDLIDNMENIKIYIRGHNLFDIFYGRFRRNKLDVILQRYIDIAPKEEFKDILEVIDSFYYFENRKKEEKNNE